MESGHFEQIRGTSEPRISTNVQKFGNESLRFHSWMMRREMSHRFVLISMKLMKWAPWLVEWCLRKADRAPFYRQIFVLSRTS